MAIRVAVRHKTIYSYDRFVTLYPHIFRLRPAVHSRTSIESYSLKIEPKDHFINWQQDPFGNYQPTVIFPEMVKELKIEVEVIANLVSINPNIDSLFFVFYLYYILSNPKFTKYPDTFKKLLQQLFSMEFNY